METLDIHIKIEQGLNNIGSFAYANLEHDEIDLAYNNVVYAEIRQVFRDIDAQVHPNNFERNQYYTDYLRVLKTEYSNSGSDDGDFQTLLLPENYIHLINDTSTVIAKNCKGKKLKSEGSSFNLDEPSNECNDVSDNDELKENKFYKVIGDVKYDGVWYKDCEIIKATDVSEFYGEVEEIPVKRVSNRLTKSENIHYLLNSNLSKSKINSPISELMSDSLRVHKKNFDIASVDITYIRKPKQISYHDNINEENEFPDNVIQYFIEKAVQYIAIRTEQSQQKIGNFKAENFENL